MTRTSKLTILFLKLCGALATATLLWSILSNIAALDNESTFTILLVPFTLLVGYILVPKKLYSTAYEILNCNQKNILIVSIVLIIFSLIIRFSFSGLDYRPVSDPATFYRVAQDLIDGSGVFGRIYIGLFPYTLSYDLLLAAGFGLFGGTSALAILVINTTFDLIGAFFLYSLFKKITKNIAFSLLCVAIWLISPFSILFTVVSIPASVVSSLVFGVLYLIYMLVESIKIRSTTTQTLREIVKYSILLGLMLAALNCFRPIAIIFVIALGLYLLLAYLSKKISLVSLASSAAIVLSLLMTGNYAYGQLVHSMTGYNIGGSSGWSIFVGTNKEHRGEWNTDDKRIQINLGEKYSSPARVHQEFTKMAKERISTYSVSEIAQLLAKKSVVFSGHQKDSFFNAMSSYPTIGKSRLIRLAVTIIGYANILILLVLSLASAIRSYRKPSLDFNFIASLLLIGLFLSSMFVEVNPRYYLPLVPILYVLSLDYAYRVLRKCDQDIT